MSLLEVDIGGGELDSVQLTAKGLEVLRSLDSRCFGFLGIHCEEQLTSNRDGTTQQQQQQQPPNETNFVTRKFIQAGIKKLAKELSLGPQSPSYHPELLCQLGHLHLLLEEYKPALSVYRQYQSMYPTDSSSNVNLLYGLGLIYFHCNAYKWAIQVLQSVLELSPSFARSSEVHLRLGVIFKKREDYDRSLQHFRRALCITGPSAFNKLEIQFHIGHLCFLQGNNLAAKEVFETILSSKSVPSSIKAMTLKQLGWLYHSVPEVTNSTPDPHTKATELLTLAVGADPTSSQAWYFLGRCHAHQGCIQEAFLAYQYAISRGDDNQSNTWCSIG